MIRHLFALCICIFTCFCTNFVYAQRPNSFSVNPGVFPEELDKFLQSTGRSDIQNIADDFNANYMQGKFSTAQKNQIIKLSNEMLQSNCQIAHEFEFYLQTINALVQANLLVKFDAWHKTLSASLKKSKDDFEQFLLVSKNIFVEQKILQLGGYNWVSSSSDVELLTDGEPHFYFKNLNLYCFTPGDTVEIYQTSGKFYPAKKLWIGKGGRIDWSRVGLDTTKVFAVIKKYQILLNDGLIVADSSLLTNKFLQDKPLLGKVIEKPLGKSQGDKSIYPQFEGYFNEFTGVNYGKGKFKGGFGMRGAMVIGKGNDTRKAELWFSYKNKPFLRVQSPDFFVKENKISVEKAEVTLFLGNDSIYHPQLSFNYLMDKDKISFYRDSKIGISAAPFIDSYHNIEFWVDEIKWDVNSPKIDIDNISGDVPAMFQSLNFFRDVQYEKIGGMLNYNPLQRIKQFTEEFNTNSFSLEFYASKFKSNVSELRIQMIDLNDKGFIKFDGPKNMVYVKRKLIDFVNAHNGRTDYDAIAFKSIISSIPNGYISLENNDLVVQGVPKFNFSDSQNVYIIPKEQIITVKKDRGMSFSGKLRAGKADFYGNNFVFDYAPFKIRLNNIDSLKFLFEDDSLGKLVHVRSVLQNIYGTLEIDHPYNKSGRRHIAKYPIFTSEVGSKVFYDYPSTQKGVYDRNRFYFAVDPFVLDSLSDLNLYSLALQGTFVSGGILPDMRHEIYLQKDQSLGFYIPIDSSYKYSLYGGKGTAIQDLSLSNDGLIGSGMISYLASRSYSKRFVYLLDSMNSSSYFFENDRTSLFPTIIRSPDVYNHWIPYQDTMFISNDGDPLKIAYDGAKLYGTIILTPHAMNAKGRMEIEGGELIADIFELKPVEVLSNEAIFRQRNPIDTTQIAFVTTPVKAYVNLDLKFAEFTYRNFPAINNTFYLNQYKGSFEKLHWEMIPKTLTFTGPINANSIRNGSYLISTRASQDSLIFSCATNFMTLEDYTMTCRGIPHILIADSKVVPDSGKAVIREQAEMDMLLNAKITADTITQYHKIDKVTIKINGKLDCRGAGNYSYFDKNKKEQKFYLDQIYVAERRYLEGKTLIPDSINFMVGPKIGFRGNAILKSFNKNLEYNGFFKAIHQMPLPRTDWFRAASVINPDSIYIPLTPPITNLNRQTLSTGFFVSNDSTHVYSSFFSRKRNTTDQELLKCEGTFTYFEQLDEFRIGSLGKIYGLEKRGNFFAMSEQKQIAYGDGKFNFGMETQGFSLKAGGYASLNLADTTFAMKLSMVIDMLLPQQAIKLMSDSLVEQTAGDASNYFDNRVLKYSIPNLVEEKTFKKLDDNLEDELSGKNLEELHKTFFITDLPLTWETSKRAFVNNGEIGLKSIDKFPIERRIKARFELVKKRGGDELTFYIQPPQGSWYYFKYQRGLMTVLSSDILFNDVIKNNVDKISKEKEDYKLKLGNISDRNKYVRGLKK